MNEDELRNCFNEVDTLTAVCRSTDVWPHGECPELEIGKTYKVTHIGVFSWYTEILLEGLGDKKYTCGAFDLYEKGKSLSKDYVHDKRFLAPYLKSRLGLFPAIGNILEKSDRFE